jgi:hypothetical protein
MYTASLGDRAVTPVHRMQMGGLARTRQDAMQLLHVLMICPPHGRAAMTSSSFRDPFVDVMREDNKPE